MKIKYIHIIIFLSCAFRSFGQKLPNVQQTSLRAPNNVKVDGKVNEWGKFEAYNNATGLYYTMANDRENLYLALQASDPNVLTKVTNRGVLIVINTSGQKNDRNVVSVNYPVFELQYNNKPFIQFSNTSGLTAQQRHANESNPDSMLTVMNKKLKSNDKYIRTTGMTNVDTLLSIYNETGITVGQSFEKGPVYNYEIAIPLKYLKLSSKPGLKFAYHIVLNGISVEKDLGLQMREDASGTRAYSFAPGASSIKREDMKVVFAATDFFGEYILAK